MLAAREAGDANFGVLTRGEGQQADGSKAASADTEPRPEPMELLAEMPPEVIAEAEKLAGAPDLMTRVLGDIRKNGVVGEERLSGLLYLMGTSRLLPRPLAMIVQGPSSSGKSYTVQKVATLFPPESVIHATQMTPQALFYTEPGLLKHKFVVGGERSRMEDDETAEKTRALRELISEGRITKLVPVKDEHGKMKTVQLEVEGPIAYVETTTLGNIFNEDANRMIWYTTDETHEQTARIIAAEGRRRSGSCEVLGTDIAQRHHALQRALSSFTGGVVVPFAERLATRFPTDRLEARRIFGQFLSVVEASTLLHGYQRDNMEDGRLIANRDDYELAMQLMEAPLLRSVGGVVSDGARTLFQAINDRVAADAEFTISDLMELGCGARETVRQRVKELQDANFVRVESHSRGPQGTSYVPTGKAMEDVSPIDLPAWEDLERRAA